jgi:hypothetical protein
LTYTHIRLSPDMRSQKLKHRFPPFQEVGSGIVIHASLSGVESIQPILLSRTLV